MPIIEPPKSVILNVLNKALFQAILKIFEIKSVWRNKTEINENNDEEKEEIIGKLSNKYYGG